MFGSCYIYRVARSSPFQRGRPLARDSDEMIWMTRMAVVSGGPDLACPQPQGGPDRQLDREQKKTSDQRPGGILFCYPSDMHE